MGSLFARKKVPGRVDLPAPDSALLARVGDAEAWAKAELGICFVWSCAGSLDTAGCVGLNYLYPGLNNAGFAVWFRLLRRNLAASLFV